MNGSIEEYRRLMSLPFNGGTNSRDGNGLPLRFIMSITFILAIVSYF